MSSAERLAFNVTLGRDRTCGASCPPPEPEPPCPPPEPEPPCPPPDVVPLESEEPPPLGKAGIGPLEELEHEKKIAPKSKRVVIANKFVFFMTPILHSFLLYVLGV